MVENTFDRGEEGWCSYDYHASVVDHGTNVFILAAWQSGGGVGGTGYVWVDNTRWSADTPEKPLSILPLLFYRRWISADPIDLRNAVMSVYLRGEELVLDGAQCFFWVHGGHTRWHCTGKPLSIPDGAWGVEPQRVVLEPDEGQWHLSWSADPENPGALGDVLGNAESYGFSFVGFSREVHGRLCMDEFQITGPDAG